MRDCTGQHARSAESIAKYIRRTFDSKNDMLRAVYSWIAQHITYDLNRLHVGITYKHESEVVAQVLKTRKTICFGYVATFKAIAEHLDIPIVVVRGYTKQNGKISNIPHSWCAVKHNNKWRLIDPTWSSGYLSSVVFHQRLNDKWFLVHPDIIIQTHIPFDPLWQFSYFPINGYEFSAGIRADSITSRFFCYPDTIKAIERLTEKERLRSENRRILASGYTNRMIDKHVNDNKTSIEYIVHNENVEIYNKAATAYNQAGSMFNKRNLHAAKTKLDEASAIINTVQNPDKDISTSIADLKKMIYKLEFQIKEML
jgi:hypothetical protein